MYRIRQSISCILILALIVTSSFSVFADTQIMSHDNTIKTIEGETLTYEEYKLMYLDSTNNSRSLRATGTTYDIPGLGEFVILGGILYYVIDNQAKGIVKTSSWIYNCVMTFIKNVKKGKEVDVSNNSNWTEVKNEKELLKKVNGEKGSSKKGKKDGTIKTEVKDKDTGKKIGEIHRKQPEYKYNSNNRKNVATGKKYPTHYHDTANKLGKHGQHHWYWD